MKNLIEEYYDAFNKKEWAKMLDLLNSDVVHEVNQGRSEFGWEAFRDFLKNMDSHYDEQVVDLVVYKSLTKNPTERFAAEFFIEGIYTKTQDGLPPAKDQRYRIRVGAFFEIRDRKISRVTNYYNLPDWIEKVSA